MQTTLEHKRNKYDIQSQQYQIGVYLCVYKNGSVDFQSGFDIDNFSKSWKKKNKVNTNIELEKHLHEDFKNSILES